MKRLRNLLWVLLILAAVGAIVAAGIVPRLRDRKVLRDQTELNAEPAVAVIHPKRATSAEEIVLPGNIQAFVDAPIYARTNGYLRRWYFDIGAKVNKGALL